MLMNQKEEEVDKIQKSSSSSWLVSDEVPESSESQAESHENNRPSEEVTNSLNDGIEELKDSNCHDVNADSVPEVADNHSNVEENSGVIKPAPDNLNLSETDRLGESGETPIECSQEDHKVDENNKNLIPKIPDQESVASDEKTNNSESNHEDVSEPEEVDNEDDDDDDDDEDEDIDDLRQKLKKMQFQLIEQKKVNLQLIYNMDILRETLMEKQEELEMAKSELSKNSLESKKNLEMLKESHSRLELATRTAKTSEILVKFMNLNISAVMDRIKKKQPIATLQDLLSLVKFNFPEPEKPKEIEKAEMPVPASLSEEQTRIDSTKSPTKNTPVEKEITINSSSTNDHCVNKPESTEPSKTDSHHEIIKSEPEIKPSEEPNKTQPLLVAESETLTAKSSTSRPLTSNLNDETEFYSAEESKNLSDGSTERIFSAPCSKDDLDQRSFSPSSEYSSTESPCNTSETSSGSSCSSPMKENSGKKKKKKQLKESNSNVDQCKCKSPISEEICTLPMPRSKRKCSALIIVPPITTQLKENTLISMPLSPTSMTKTTDVEGKRKGPKRDANTGGKNSKNQKRNKK